MTNAPVAMARAELIATYLRARLVIAALGAAAALGLGFINGWPRGAWIPVIAVCILVHARWSVGRIVRVFPVIVLDAAVVAVTTGLTDRQLVTLAGMTLVLVAAALLEQGVRVLMLWALVLGLFGIGQFLSANLPDAFRTFPNRGLTEAVSVAFLVAATAGLAQHVTPQLRRADLLRQAAEDELEARRRRFEALLEYSPGGLAVTDHTLTIVDVGVQNERVTGTSPEDRIGRSVLDLVIPEDRRVIVAAYRQVMAEPATPVHFEVSAIPPAGDIRRVSVWLRNLLEDPDIQGLVFNFQDVTAERTARAELTLVRDRLQASHQSTFGLSDARPGDDSLTGESEICADVILEDTPSAHASLE